MPDDAHVNKPIERLPEREAFVASAILRCLRQWQAAWGPAPFFLTSADLDHLESWAARLHRAWDETDACLKRDGFEVKEYPVKVTGKGPR